MFTSRPRRWNRHITIGLAVVSASVLSQTSLAATVQAEELEFLKAQARKAGWVSVLVNVHNANLQQIAENAAEVRAVSEAKVAAVIKELGGSVLQTGQWSNGMGQVGLHVTEAGLEKLLRSNQALAFFKAPNWQERSGLDGIDGGLEAIEQALLRDGEVDLELIPNIDGLQFELMPDGSHRYTADPASIKTALERLLPVLRSASAAALDANRVEQTVRVSREGLLAIAYSSAVRHLRLVGFVDRRATSIDPFVLSKVQKGETVEFILTLRTSLAGGKLSETSRTALMRSNRMALESLLAKAGSGSVVQDFSQFGAAHLRLNATDFRSLLESKDQRLLSIAGLKVVGKPHLATSAASMNMAAAWNAGYFGAGQNIIVLDTGVQANHPFFGGRVTHQYCYGTSGFVQAGFGSGNEAQHTSICPDATAATNWDSPVGTANAAAPFFGDSHGTHVAGIAAGGLKTTPPPTYRGMAPSANILAAQVFSQRGSSTQPFLVNADLLAALQFAAGSLQPIGAGQQQPYTINLSLGLGFYPSACIGPDESAFASAVLQLTNAGVPIIASTGNGGFDSAIEFPACLPNVIKVSSTVNDGIGNTRSRFLGSQAANVVNPISFGGTFWLAPGGGSASFTTTQSTFQPINSSVPGNAYANLSGTSMAAPHISGIYAVGKSVNPNADVAAWNAWFVSKSVNVTISPFAGSPPFTPFSIRRIYMSLP